MQIKKEWMIPSVIGVGCLGIGFLAGHIFTKRKYAFMKGLYLTEKDPEEDEKSKTVQLEFLFEEFNDNMNVKTQMLSRVADRFDVIHQNMKDVVDEMNDGKDELYTGRFTEESSNNEGEKEEEVMSYLTEDDPSIVSIFEDGNGEWDYDVELARRNPPEPYVVHRDEFFENEDDYRQTTLTYYAGDNILCDELNSPIYDPERIVGKLEFGHGSQDPNVVYIRNERLLADYEVLLDRGFYQVEVLGQALEEGYKSNDMKHSVRKFRHE